MHARLLMHGWWFSRLLIKGFRDSEFDLWENRLINFSVKCLTFCICCLIRHQFTLLLSQAGNAHAIKMHIPLRTNNQIRRIIILFSKHSEKRTKPAPITVVIAPTASIPLTDTASINQPPDRLERTLPIVIIMVSSACAFVTWIGSLTSSQKRTDTGTRIAYENRWKKFAKYRPGIVLLV